MSMDDIIEQQSQYLKHLFFTVGNGFTPTNEEAGLAQAFVLQTVNRVLKEVKSEALGRLDEMIQEGKNVENQCDCGDTPWHRWDCPGITIK